MDILSLLESLTNTTLASVYILYGEERFLINELVSRLKVVAIGSDTGDFNIMNLQAGSISGRDIVCHCDEMPLLGGRRMIVVSDGEKLSADDWDALDGYLANPSPTTCLVIVAERLMVQRGPIAKARKRDQLFKSDPLKTSEIGGFVKSRAKHRKVSISPGAASALVAAIGPDCAALDDALERLGLYAGSGQVVNEEHVAQVITLVREQSVFDLVDAVGQGATARAVGILERLLSQRGEPIAINAMLARHFRILLLARIHLHQRTPSNELASILGVPPFVVGKVMDQARRLSGAKLEQCLLQLAMTDLALKSSRKPARIVVEQVLLDLCLNS